MCVDKLVCVCVCHDIYRGIIVNNVPFSGGGTNGKEKKEGGWDLCHKRHPNTSIVHDFGPEMPKCLPRVMHYGGNMLPFKTHWRNYSNLISTTTVSDIVTFWNTL